MCECECRFVSVSLCVSLHISVCACVFMYVCLSLFVKFFVCLIFVCVSPVAVSESIYGCVSLSECMSVAMSVRLVRAGPE
mmetsp:Transcript_16304/g.26140  ORF Transcript_16304/g.26140 Transcript_16304/m.26140 type:complete len:80 (-) Transcript_16304:1748-1987(-)